MGEIVWLGRYPVKSMCGEELAEAHLGPSGLDGDRRYALVDAESGLVASAKNPRKWRRLLRMSAGYRADDTVVITGPDGAALDTDAGLSRVVGRPVRLASHGSMAGHGEAKMERLTPETEPGAGVMTLSDLGSAGTFADFAAVHIVTTATLEALGRPDHRRFRPNLVVRLADAEPFVENTWSGRTLTIGDGAVIRVLHPTPRCAVPTLAQGDDLPDDPAVLRAAARANRVALWGPGPLTCVGAYGSVERTGALRVGDVVRVAA
ncbi:MOSC domain-containing protein [Dactylosporangium matsuzakiense]|uniref:Molybdenum cofactor biosynthesis protein n=1 Tax=Dactylosporangium matsuzakiense TaxID=53360 RepID=A0A9W6KGZ0_9ACTN|nr:MOSC N-terminal beta barrel domain-containing protein [Dactylosporangium matsuzakiense]UWZ41080.1 MOSC domain-containing protein [Dactylosporangium matsuzakiense]GLL01023.1 molybdenum cofactor biosynthesis protein [Dactylosporangium matsuzakiense]